MRSRAGVRRLGDSARIVVLIPILTVVSVRLSYGETRGIRSPKGAQDRARKYGCENWPQCRSRMFSPPYQPEQPEKCDDHDAWMTTLIPAGAD
jgi:hypothetical protein